MSVVYFKTTTKNHFKPKIMSFPAMLALLVKNEISPHL